jgi:CSLREA domain-containing protein
LKFARLTLLAVAIAAFALLFAQPGPALAVTFTVNSTGDAGDPTPDGVCATVGGVCTLRAAIQESNAQAGADVINFNIPGAGPHTIAPASALPTISGPLTINGYSQPGASANTNAITAASNAVLKIQLDGISAGNVTGLTITATGGSSTVRGLVINRFIQHGIGLTLNGGDTIAGNYIGTDVQGLADLGNSGAGVVIVSPGNTIGGTAAADRNVISGNQTHGILMTDSTVTGTTVSGNFIGVGSDRITSLGNTQNGVHIDSSAANNMIGGVAAGAANVVAFNGGDGVNIFAGGGTGNAIRGNSIHSNGSLSSHLGIDLGANGVTANDAGDGDTGPNNLQNFPVLTYASSFGGVTGIGFSFNSSASQTFTFDFYRSASCDASGNGEGQNYIGSTTKSTGADGNALLPLSMSFPIMTGEAITATATNSGGSTSEFSNCVRDSDTDGWSDAAEGVIGTDPLDACRDDPSDNAWPPDFNNDSFVDISDVSTVTGLWGATVPPFPPRHDVAPGLPDGFVDITDVSKMTGLFGTGCGP